MRTLIVSAVLLAGCGVSQSEINQGGDARGEDNAELSTSSRTLVALRRDLRKCASPMCGGYYVHDVNRVHLSETYVSGLDFSSSILGDREQSQILEAADGEVVLRGKLGPKDSHDIRSFIVSDAWRGMPGAAPAATDLVFSVKSITIECFVAPCPSMQAKKGNATATTNFHQLQTYGLGHFINGNWLQDQALANGALVAGTVAAGTDDSGATIQVLSATQVFVQLPYEHSACPVATPASCSSGKVRPYERGANLCLTYHSCMNTGICNYLVPNCGDGYTAFGYTGTNGCAKVECDPTWLNE